VCSSDFVSGGRGFALPGLDALGVAQGGCPTRDGPVAGGGVVRAGRAGTADRQATSGVAQRGVCMATAVAGRR
jgi:hypothetical protein